MTWACRGVEDVVLQAHGIGPKESFNRLWPSMFCMDQTGPCAILQLSNTSFGLAVLEVGVYAAEADRLPLAFDSVQELVVGKASIVGMIVKDLHSHLVCVTFKCLFCCDGFLTRVCFLQIDKAESAEMIDKYSGKRIPLFCVEAFDLSN